MLVIGFREWSQSTLSSDVQWSVAQSGHASVTRQQSRGKQVIGLSPRLVPASSTSLLAVVVYVVRCQHHTGHVTRTSQSEAAKIASANNSTHITGGLYISGITSGNRTKRAVERHLEHEGAARSKRQCLEHCQSGGSR